MTKRLPIHLLDPAGADATNDTPRYNPATGRLEYAPGGSSSTATQLVRESFTANADDQVLTLGGAPTSDASPYVWVNGALLWPGDGYSITDNVIHLTDPLTAGDALWLSYETADEAPVASTLAPLTVTTPDDFAGLIQWLDADQLALSDLDVLATWGDASGNGHDFAAVNAPTFRTNQINGKPCVDFVSTSSHYLSFPGFADDVFTRWTAFVVWRPDSTTYATLWGQDRSGYNDDFLFGVDPANINTPNSKVSFQIQQAAGSTLRTVTEANPVATGVWRINDFRYDGTTLDLRLDGALQATLAVSGLQADANTEWQLGRNRSAGGWYYDGGLAELVFYNVALSDADRDSVRTGLATKYGLTLA